MDAALDQLFAAHHGVLLRWQVLEAVTEGTARGLVRRGALVVLRHGVYGDGRRIAEADPTTLALMTVRAESLVRRREEVATGLTAAAAHGLPFLGRLPKQPQLSLRREDGERPRKDRPRSWLPDEEVTTVSGLQVATVARTVVDVARTRPFAFAVVTADAALARGTTREELLRVLDRCRRWPGSRSARRVVEFADPLSESASESLGRARFEEGGLPRPELQVEVRDVERVVRVDHRWAQFRTVAEADGLLKYDSPEVLREEKLREDWLRDRGEQVARYVWDEALRRPDVIVDRLRRAFTRSTWRAA